MPEGYNKCAFLEAIAYEYDSLNLEWDLFLSMCWTVLSATFLHLGIFKRLYFWVNLPYIMLQLTHLTAPAGTY